jgi:HD superfamily phosphohydrolase
VPFKPQRIRDPLHNLIEFRANEFENALWRVIQSKAFQRLRRVKQLGFSDLVYPGAAHSRFAHSVGVFHTARRLMKVIEGHLGQQAYETTKANVALAASLVHDLGHGPFSHAFEDVGRRLNLRLADHENVTDVLIRESEVRDALKRLGSGFANDVADVIKSKGPGNIYSAVVSSQFDADRLDYMRRDRLMTGTHLGEIDFEWLVANLEVGKVPHGVDESRLQDIETFVLGPKAIHAAETYVLGLFQLYPTVYFHKATRGAEKLFTELLFRVITLCREGDAQSTGLPASHPLARFSNDPDNIELVLQLDDTVVWGALSMMSDASDTVVRDLAVRLRDRRLFKCIDVREHIANRLGTAALDDTAVDRACASIGEKVGSWIAEKAAEPPRILLDQAEREPYKQFQESKGPLNQIMIRTAGDRLVDLGERSKIVKAIESFRLFRVYVAEHDQEAKRFIERAIEAEDNNGART